MTVGGSVGECNPYRVGHARKDRGFIPPTESEGTDQVEHSTTEEHDEDPKDHQMPEEMKGDTLRHRSPQRRGSARR